ncbi:AMP-dependent synthetase and ligase, partial [mine drainage metagenome]
MVAYTENGVIDAVGFGRLVAGITLQVRNLPEQRWALVCQDTLWFAAGFLALTQASKTIILPQTNQPSSVQTARATAILTDQPMRFSSFVTLDPAQAADADGLGSMDLDPQLNIELYTSGSTGQPKRVDKYLGQLHAEVTELENMWGGMLGDAVVVATV